MTVMSRAAGSHGPVRTPGRGGRGVSWQQRSLAVGAAAYGLFVASLVCASSSLGIVFLVPAALLTAPLFLFRRPSEFALAAGVTGGAGLFFGVFGFMLGLFLFLPAATALVLAAFADGHERPRTAGILTGIGSLVLASAFCWLGSVAWTYVIAPAL
ncbi:hypothetical protein ABZY31_27875 [Streptomyces sp. NPDC006529]|uniref:hypothetical protein n=1 Tax=Streptomyces sp. NPDC006529 TaxID=3157177 RepID=UPI0033BF7AB4